MAVEDGAWAMRGLDWDDPSRTQSQEEFTGLVNEVGFPPLFKNEIDSFSAEENTSDLYWWAGDEEQDLRRQQRLITRSSGVAYDKFFDDKAGFISRAWFPRFANWQKGDYDSGSRWSEGLVITRQKRIIDQFLTKDEWFSFELKRQAGFGRGGEKNFEGAVTNLQMSGYLLIRDFRRWVNKKGFPYSWHISVYSTPETLWGYNRVSSAYSVAPAGSKDLIDKQIWRNLPEATQEELDAVLDWTR